MTGARILLVQPTAERYGGDKALLLLARGLTQRGWRVRVAVQETGPLTDDLTAAGVPWEIAETGAVRRVFRVSDWLRFAGVRLPSSIAQIRRLARYADVVHVNSSVSLGGVLGGWVARRPVVLHVRESHAGHLGAWRGYARLIGRRASRVITISEAIADEARATTMATRVELVHDGLEFPPLPASTDAPSDVVHVVSVGRLNDWKGHELVVAATAELRRRGIDVRTTIAGDVYPGQEPVRQALVAQIHEAGLEDRVDLPGFVEDVEALLATATVFVQASRRPEPFGLALLEAMAQGVPCIASAHGGPVDIIDDGTTGLLVAPGDATAIADAVERLWRDPARRTAMARAGAVDVRQRFGIERSIDGVEAVYRSLLA